MDTLKTFLAHRGSLTAAARHLGVLPATVLRWARGDWTPAAVAQDRIHAMISTLFFDPTKKRLEKLSSEFSEVKSPKKAPAKNFSEKSSCAEKKSV